MVDEIVGDADLEVYDMLVLPGGVANLDILRSVPAGRSSSGERRGGQALRVICYVPWTWSRWTWSAAGR